MPCVPRPGEKLSRSIDDYPEGIILPVDKPYRWTSADVIRKVKYAAIHHFGKKNLKVGHAGTLDPLATGVLLVCIGNACKMADNLQRHDKEYVAGVAFGATTPSYDLEKDIDRFFPFDHITEDSVRAVLPSFLGEQEQIAPLFSAKSVDGIRAYEIARKMYHHHAPAEATANPDSAEIYFSGRGPKNQIPATSFLRHPTHVETASFDDVAAIILQRNIIRIDAIELLSFGDGSAASVAAAASESGASGRINVTDTSQYGFPVATIRIACSKGTYIRAFARDLGEALGSGAHLQSLVRTKTGDFRVETALSLGEALSCLAK